MFKRLREWWILRGCHPKATQQQRQRWLDAMSTQRWLNNATPQAKAMMAKSLDAEAMRDANAKRLLEMMIRDGVGYTQITILNSEDVIRSSP